MEQTQFQHHGFSKDYYLNGKYIGTAKAEKDREVFGYHGRKAEILADTIVFSKSKKLKANQQVVTELNVICGRIIK